MSKKVFIALSGGVDSSVAATLLKERGFDVYGIHMKMWDPKDSYWLPTASGPKDALCRQQFQDRIDAMRVAATLDIPSQTWDFTKEYRRAVVEYMIREYTGGRTPNPDVMCNRHIKFGLFLERALRTGADWVATGHYVRKVQGSKFKVQSLRVAHDTNKDQSYFLWTLTQDQLRHCLFPIGDYTKPEVRAMARERRLPTAEKPDSQGVCFIGEFDMRDFLKRYLPERPGRVLTTAGKVVGEHEGTEFFTIGQRQGLGIGGGIPYYVADKDLETNTLFVAEGPYDEKLFRRELVATDVNWISGQEQKFPLRCEAKIRYRQPVQPCWVEPLNHADNTQTHAEKSSATVSVQSTLVRVVFDEEQRAITPGQSIVFYRGNPFDGAQGKELIGGAIIA